MNWMCPNCGATNPYDARRPWCRYCHTYPKIGGLEDDKRPPPTSVPPGGRSVRFTEHGGPG